MQCDIFPDSGPHAIYEARGEPLVFFEINRNPSPEIRGSIFAFLMLAIPTCHACDLPSSKAIHPLASRSASWTGPMKTADRASEALRDVRRRQPAGRDHLRLGGKRLSDMVAIGRERAIPRLPARSPPPIKKTRDAMIYIFIFGYAIFMVPRRDMIRRVAQPDVIASETTRSEKYTTHATRMSGERARRSDNGAGSHHRSPTSR